MTVKIVDIIFPSSMSDEEAEKQAKRARKDHSPARRAGEDRHRHNRRRRLAPPPQPPESLVHLLQTDTKVLHYFQSLSANLQADVQIWKNRANRWQKKYHQLQQRQSSQSPSKKTTSSKQSLSSFAAKNDHEPNLDDAVSIEDFMWEEESSSSSDNDDGDKNKKKAPRAVRVRRTETESPKTTRAPETPPEVLAMQKQMRTLLYEAHEALERLGIALVKEEQVSKLGENQERTVKDGVYYVPRSTSQVVTSLLFSVRNLTRLSRLDDDWGNDYAPFDPMTCCPIFDVNTRSSTQNTAKPPHPAIEGRQLLAQALDIMDTCCPDISDSVDVNDWEALFDVIPSSDEESQLVREFHVKTRIGLRNGKAIVQELLHSLHGEISEAWATHDRTARLTNEALHLDEGNVTKDSHEDSALTGVNGDDRLSGASTSQSHLALLLERYWLSQLAIGLHLSRGHADRAFDLILSYISSSVPSLNGEDYPELPPVLSLVVIRGLLFVESFSNNNRSTSSWFFHYLEELVGSCFVGKDELLDFKRVFISSILFSHLISKRRLICDDSGPIRDVALVEIASYEKICKNEPELEPKTTYDDYFDTAGKELRRRVSSEITSMLEKYTIETNQTHICVSLRDWALRIAYILNGTRQQIVSTILDRPMESLNIKLLTIVTYSYRQVVLRHLDVLLQRVGQRRDERLVADEMSPIASRLFEVLKASHSRDSRYDVATATLDSAALLSDGSIASSLVNDMIQWENEKFSKVSSLTDLYECMRKVGMAPLARVINLEGRKDRLCAIRAQALREHILLSLAVPSLKEDLPSSENDYFFGCHAFNGDTESGDFRSQFEELGGPFLIDSFVNIEWRPNDLKPFDKDAPSHEELVHMSESEVACALSHAKSWTGALRSMKIQESADFLPEKTTGLFHHADHLSRLFKIAGFAEGEALLPENEDMPPSAVCLILEDDAVLVDRFRQKLSDLLKELPRDFHFCSLGFGRPKTAPIAKYGTYCGIPSHLFYMTGYLLSESGAEYLLDRLPIVGPVDSWIGLKMTSNWDNILGTAMGVGIQTSPYADAPSRKDLRQILKFRAFCALNPLCSQRVGTVRTSSNSIVPWSAPRNWRLRDTDVEYSGDRAKRP